MTSHELFARAATMQCLHGYTEKVLFSDMLIFSSRVGTKLTVKWSIIKALESELRRKDGRGIGWEERMESSLVSPHRGAQGLGRGRRLNRRKGTEEKRGGEVLIQPSQSVDVTCLHTQLCCHSHRKKKITQWFILVEHFHSNWL